MPRKTEYCIAVQIGERVHRSWTTRKAEAVAYGRELKKLAPFVLIGGIKAVSVVDVQAPADVIAFEWPAGATARLF
jgi:hypothetical protein